MKELYNLALSADTKNRAAEELVRLHKGALTMILTKGVLPAYFIIASVLLSFNTSVNAASLTFTPAQDQLDYGDVYIGQMANNPVFTIRADGGSCSGTIGPDPSQPAPPSQQTIAPPTFNLANGETTESIWIGILSTEPGDHNFYIKVTSNCGTYSKTISFHCIGYGYIQGSVTDAQSGVPLLTATVEPANPYLMEITMLGNGNYSARGYPGYHWLIAKASGYTDQMVNIEIQEDDNLTHDFQMIRALQADPDSLKIALKKTGSVQIVGTQPPYTVTSDSPEIASAIINETLVSVTGNKIGQAVLTIRDNGGNQAMVTVQVVSSAGGLPAVNLLLMGGD